VPKFWSCPKQFKVSFNHPEYGGNSMLAGKRAVRVGDQLLREIADLLLSSVRDPRVKGVTLTGVDLSRDLRHAKVFYSLIGDERESERVQLGLDSAKGFIKRELAARMELKYMPDIIFRRDLSLEEGNRMERFFERLKSGESGDALE
jgi:ribosome-binding factor A